MTYKNTPRAGHGTRGDTTRRNYHTTYKLDLQEFPCLHIHQQWGRQVANCVSQPIHALRTSCFAQCANYQQIHSYRKIQVERK